jgi:hypothetical protein
MNVWQLHSSMWSRRKFITTASLLTPALVGSAKLFSQKTGLVLIDIAGFDGNFTYEHDFECSGLPEMVRFVGNRQWPIASVRMEGTHYLPGYEKLLESYPVAHFTKLRNSAFTCVDFNRQLLEWNLNSFVIGGALSYGCVLDTICDARRFSVYTACDLVMPKIETDSEMFDQYSRRTNLFMNSSQLLHFLK